MKKLLYLVIILLGMGILSSCSKEGGSNSIIGSWKVVYSEDYGELSVGEVWTFEKGGTLLIDGYPAYQYRYDAQTKILKVAASGEFYVQSITATRMRWGYPDEPDAYYAEFERVK